MSQEPDADPGETQTTDDQQTALIEDPAEDPRKKTHYALICRLLVDVAPVATRQVFNGVYPPLNLGDALNKPEIMVTLKRLLTHKVLSDAQWKLLYPEKRLLGASNGFDVLLLTTLLKYACHLSVPYPNGWTGEPLNSDLSLGADLVRIQEFRTKLYKNYDRILTLKEFKSYFKKISEVLERIGGGACRVKIEKLAKEVLDEGAETVYTKALIDWHSRAVSVEATEQEVEKFLRKKVVVNEAALLLQDPGKGGKGHGKHGDLQGMKIEEMRLHERSVLMKHSAALLDTINAEDVVPKLIQRSVLTHEEKNRIYVNSKNADRMKMVLDILPNKANGFDKFCDVIKYKYSSLQEQLVKAKQAPFTKEKPDETTLVSAALRLHYEEMFRNCSPVSWHPTVSVPITDFIVPWNIVDHNRSNINVDDIFDPHDKCANPRRVLIHGSSGSGKTLLSKYMALQWSTHQAFHQFRMVFRIDARRTKGLVKAILQQCLPDNFEMSQSNFHTVLNNRQQKVLFIIDAYEACPDLESDLLDLIHKRLYPKSSFVVLMNSDFVTSALSRRSDTKLVLTGITNHSQADLVKNYAQAAEIYPDKINKLVHKMTYEPEDGAYLLGSNPFFCLCLCLISEMQGSLEVTTETGLLKEFLKALLTKFCNRKLMQINDENTPEEVQTLMRAVELVAHIMLTQRLNTYLCENITEIFKAKMEAWFNIHPADIFTLGIFHIESSSKKGTVTETASFPQRVLMEFLTARHLSHETELQVDSYSSDHLAPVLPLLCGISHSAAITVIQALSEENKITLQTQPPPTAASTSTTSQFSSVEHSTTRAARLLDLSLTLKCLAELKLPEEDQNPPELEQLWSTIPERLSMKRKDYHSAQMIAGLSVIIKADIPQLTELELRLDEFSLSLDTPLMSLAKAIEANSHITTLKIHWINDDFLSEFLHTIFGANQSITSLYMADISGSTSVTTSATVWSNLKSIQSNMQKVTTLGFTDCQNPGLVASFITHCHPAVECLSLSGCHIDLVGAQNLCSLVEKTSTLKGLDLSAAEMSRGDFLKITLGARLNRTMTELKLASMSIQHDNILALVDLLKFNGTLQRLDLSHNALSEESCTVLGQALSAENTMVSELCLEGCELNQDAMLTLKKIKRRGLKLSGFDGRRTVTAAGVYGAEQVMSDAGKTL